MTKEYLSFEGQVMLVLGASGGMGRAVCESLTERGARVVGIGSDHENPVSASRPYAEYYLCDLSKVGATEECINDAWESHGPFDGLINIAGVFPARNALDSSEELFDSVFDMNVRSGLVSAVCARQGIGGTVSTMGIDRS